MPKPPACDSCRRKKISCDRRKPRCEWCLYRDIACTYGRSVLASPNSGSKVRPVTHQRQSSSVLESSINPSPIHGASKNHDPPSRAATTEDAIFYGGLQFAGLDLGDIFSNNGVPVFSERARRWIEEQIGIHGVLSSIHELPQNSSDASNLDSRGMLVRFGDFIQRDDVVAWADVWSSSSLRLVFPAVDPHTLQDMTEAAYDTLSPMSPAANRAKIYIMAFAAMLSKLEPGHVSKRTRDNAGLFAAVAEQYLLAQLAHPTSEALQACLLLAIHHDMSGETQSAAVLVSLACRSVFTLGGHKIAASSKASQVRQYFWLCYFLDKHISLRTGQPSVLDDRLIDLEVPPNYNFYGLQQDGDQRMEYCSSSFLFPSDLRLTKIKSRILDVLHPEAVARKTNSQLLLEITTMDNELEAWRLSVPQKFRPRLSAVTTSIHEPIHHGAKMLIIFSHLEYFYLLAAVHRASGRSEMWWDVGTLELGALRSSMQVSVEASRSTLRLLRDGVWDVHKQSLCMFVFYPIWAAITIFCYLLYDPASTEAIHDLTLLRLVPQLIKSIPYRQNHARDEAQLEALGCFLDELASLGSHAIDRAQREDHLKLVK